MNPTLFEVLGAVLFGFAVLHTFVCSKFMQISHHYPAGSARGAIFHFLGEIEVVFGIWAAIFYVLLVLLEGMKFTNTYFESLHFLEPLFVFVIMVVASTKPVLYSARLLMNLVSAGLQKVFSVPDKVSDLFTVLFLGSLSGSFITEPAAMTVAALLLAGMIRSENKKFLYALIAVLFVNVSIGGALTPFAAPPILMVAQKWGWDFEFVFTHLGWKSAIAVFINSFLFCFIFRKEVASSCESLEKRIAPDHRVPVVVIAVHLLFLAMIVIQSHYVSVFFGVFLLFLGVTTITKKYQSGLRLREALLVAFFLGGIIVFGGAQKWWLQPLLAQMSDFGLFMGSVGLTAVTDNAALTYLGSQVEGLTASSRYSLVAGAIAGGGLTVIANAPNAAGYSILNRFFGSDGLNPLALFVAALAPTLIAVLCLWLL